MKKWFLCPVLSAPMSFQLAFDEVLFRDTIKAGPESTPLLRFYYSSEKSMTVGYSHRNGNGYSSTLGPVIRRITGGGEVHHGNDLIFSLIAPKNADKTFKTVRISYWKIHEAVKLALEILGGKPRFYRKDEPLPQGRDCFRYPIASDLALSERKIAGGAQKRSMGMMLHQESLRLDLLEGKTGETLQRVLREGFEKVFDVRLENIKIDPEWIFEAEKLAEEKYRTDFRPQTTDLSFPLSPAGRGRSDMPYHPGEGFKKVCSLRSVVGSLSQRHL